MDKMKEAQRQAGREVAAAALTRCNGNMADAARIIGISRAVMVKRVYALNINPNDFRIPGHPYTKEQ